MWLPWLALVATPVILLLAPPVLMLSLHIVQKASTSGAPFLQYGTDVTVALVLGLSFVACIGFLGGQLAMRLGGKIWVSTASLDTPAIAVPCCHMMVLMVCPCISKYVSLYCCCLQVAVILLFLSSSTFGICWMRTMKPYTMDVPKKIYMYHMHHLDSAGHVQNSTWDLAAIDSAPVSWALPAGLASLPQEEWKKPSQLVLYPVNNFMQVHTPSLPPVPCY